MEISSGYDVGASADDVAPPVAAIGLQHVLGPWLDLVVLVAVHVVQLPGGELGQHGAASGIGRGVLEGRCRGATHRDLGDL